MADIYLDYAAAALPADSVVRAMVRATKQFANPSSFNDAGRAAAGALAQARGRIARFLHARTDEIVLCASGSEANTLALIGAVKARGRRGKVLASGIEHLSVLEPLRYLSKNGYTHVTIPADEYGRIDLGSILSKISSSVSLVSVMYANNEIGTIQPIARIGRAISQWRRSHHSQFPLFHVDACQATTTLDMDVQRLGVDLLTLNGSKAYGPHGTAVLFVRRGVALTPIVLGGSQERGRRAGTESVAGAVGLAAALAQVRPSESRRLSVLRDRLIEGILEAIPAAHLNGPQGLERLAGNVNVSIPGCDSESLLLELDRHGIRAGSGSACTAHSVEPSHVLTAIGTPKQYLDGAIRFSLGRGTTRMEIEKVIRMLPKVVVRVRSRRARNEP